MGIILCYTCVHVLEVRDLIPSVFSHYFLGEFIMKFRKGMKFVSLINNDARTLGQIYTIKVDHNYTCFYVGDEGQESCQVNNLSTVRFLPMDEVSVLDMFQHNFRKGF